MSTTPAQRRKLVAADELVGVQEIAEILGIAGSTIRAYLSREQMPVPFRRLRSGPVWLLKDIEKWQAQRNAV